MAIKTYKKTDKTKLSKNFRVSEFVCNGNGCCSTAKIDESLVSYLQKIRDHFGKAITITSGYRCVTHNKNVGGASASRHTKGQAADIVVKGIAPVEVAKYAETIGILGIGLYEAKDGNFVHIDTRTTKSFWYGHKQERRTTFAPEYKLAFTTLARGDKGKDVKALQILVAGHGYADEVGAIDGDFGAKTEGAVKLFQERNGLVGNGTADVKTMAALLGV